MGIIYKVLLPFETILNSTNNYLCICLHINTLVYVWCTPQNGVHYYILYLTYIAGYFPFYCNQSITNTEIYKTGSYKILVLHMLTYKYVCVYISTCMWNNCYIIEVYYGYMHRNSYQATTGKSIYLYLWLTVLLFFLIFYIELMNT